MARFDRFRAPPRAKGLAPAVRAALTKPAWLPQGAVAYADFVNGRYYAGGAQTTLSGLFAQDAAYGTWGGGLPLTAGAPVFKPVIGTLPKAATCVVELAAPGVWADGWMVDFVRLPEFDIGSSVGGGADSVIGQDFNDSIWVEVAGLAAGATHRIAMTVTATRIALSVNGGAVSGGNGDTGAADYDSIGVTAGSATIRSIALYAPRPDSDLPALSAF